MNMQILRINFSASLAKLVCGSCWNLFTRRMQALLNSATPGARAASSFISDKAYVNGKWVPAKSGKTFQVLNPATLEIIGAVPDMDAADTEHAIEAAHKAFQSWRETTAKERSTILRKWYELIIANQEELGKLITAEMGKPLAEGKGEVAYGAGFVEWYAEEAKRLYGDVLPTPVKSKRLVVIKQPIGVAGMITPKGKSLSQRLLPQGDLK